MRDPALLRRAETEEENIDLYVFEDNAAYKNPSRNNCRATRFTFDIGIVAKGQYIYSVFLTDISNYGLPAGNFVISVFFDLAVS